MIIPLTAEIRTYALSVAQVGELMRITGNKFGEVSGRRFTSVEEAKRTKVDYETLLGEFVSQKETLEKLHVPAQLKDEHNELIRSYSKFVDATEMGIQSLDTEKISVDEAIMDKALKLQREASKGIVKTSDEIALKLGIK
ncbi:MAG: hypothetical protein ACQEXX_15875 [Bacillota bacterium]